uniref:Putative Ras-related protein Rab-3 n=1 Tax=Hypsibius dujardini TaxID=232323 RepID=A0A0U3C7U0_HYPDU|nr:putative Ras-related protein Rab-3 [Hypsibius dujardini]
MLQSCGCFSLGTGCICVAIYHFIVAVVVASYTVFGLSSGTLAPSYKPIEVVLATVIAVAAVLLLIGVHRRSRPLVLTWYIFTVIRLITQVGLLIYIIVLHSNMTKSIVSIADERLVCLETARSYRAQLGLPPRYEVGLQVYEAAHADEKSENDYTSMGQNAGNGKWQKDAADQNFDYMFKLLIIGNSSVGKTSFLFRYADDSFTSAFVSTVGIDFKVKTVYRNDKRVKLQIWDTAGQERYRTITTAYYRVGNKCDMEDDRVITTDRGRQLADQLGLEFFETSAKENTNVKAVFERLVDIICDKMAESVDSDPSVVTGGAAGAAHKAGVQRLGAGDQFQNKANGQQCQC